MACNPPYKRGVTGQWDKCRFPGVLRQDCYDYINFDYNCTSGPPPTPPPPTGKPCGTSSNAGNDEDAYESYSFPSAAGNVTFTYQSYGVPDGFRVESSDGEVYFDTGGLVSGGGSVTFCKKQGVTLINVIVTSNPGGGTAWAYSISCPVSGNGCGPNPTPTPTPSPTCPTYTFSESGIPGGVGNCLGGSIFYGERTVPIPSYISKPVKVTITGGVDDEFILNGQVIDAGLYPFAGTPPCNGAHLVNHSFITSDNSFTIACGDNHGVSTSYNLTVCFEKAPANCNITLQLKTTGCCLEVESTGRIYAVGSGTVSARIISGFCSSCSDFSVYINERKNSAVVQDGSTIIVSGRSTKCKCNRKTPWISPGGFRPGPCYNTSSYRMLKNIETGVYQIQLNLNTSSQNDCGCG